MCSPHAQGELTAGEIAALLPGAWRLVGWTVTRSDGRRSTPFGEEPSGYLLYTADGHMAVCVEERAPAGSGTRDRSPRVFGYAGTFAVEEGAVVHAVKAATVPSMTGTTQRREVLFENDRLALSAVDESRGRMDRIVWKRPSDC